MKLSTVAEMGEPLMQQFPKLFKIDHPRKRLGVIFFP